MSEGGFELPTMLKPHEFLCSLAPRGPPGWYHQLGLHCPALLPLYRTLPTARPRPHGDARVPTLFPVPGVTGG